MWVLGFGLRSAEFSQPGCALLCCVAVDEAQLVFSTFKLVRGPGARKSRQKGRKSRQGLSAGSLQIATLCLSSGGPFLVVVDLLFRNLSACSKRLCFKVSSLLTGVSFNFITFQIGPSSIPKYKRHPGCIMLLKVNLAEWLRRVWALCSKPPSKKTIQAGFLCSCYFHVAHQLIHYPPFFTFYLAPHFPPWGTHTVFRTPSSQKWEDIWLNPTPSSVQEKAAFSHCWGKSGADSLKSVSRGFLASVKQGKGAPWPGSSLNGQHEVEESRGHLWGKRGVATQSHRPGCWRDVFSLAWRIPSYLRWKWEDKQSWKVW